MMRRLIKNLICFGILPFLIIIFGLGIRIFITGFIPEAAFNSNLDHVDLVDDCLAVLQNNETCERLNQRPNSRKFDKIILIVIDAFRADFVPSIIKSEFNVSLPFLEKKIKENSAISFVSKVSSPTVTLPRIKTLVSGKTSSFLDIIYNFNAKELTDDNFLHQAKKKGLNSVFYGDETWLKVFPNFFLRSAGTHSFFVQDFKEVDDNVTRHLGIELSLNDWDIMILHYLGVDHIGHGFGPKSILLDSKLKEMDSIIQTIYQSLKLKQPLNSLIVICGDHGMTSEGNHGGPSKSETLTPLIFLTVNDIKYKVDSSKEMVSQNDIATTLSILLGLPIPKSSTGSVILDVLNYSNLSEYEILSAFCQNVMHLYLINKKENSDYNQEIVGNISDIIKLHLEFLNLKQNKEHSPTYKILLNKYIYFLNLLKDIHHHHNDYCLSRELLGLCFIIFSWIGLILSSYDIVRNEILKYCHKPFFLKFCVVYFLTSIIFSLFQNYAILLTFAIAFFIYVVLILVILLIDYFHLLSFPFIEKISIIFFILYALSLFSSSFIEKEYLLWYFSITTIFILLAAKVASTTLRWYIIGGMNSKRINLFSAAKIFFHFIQTHDLNHILLLLLSHYALREYGSSSNQELVRENPFNLKEFFFQHHLCLLMSQIIIMIYMWQKQKNKIAFKLFCFGLILSFMYKISFKPFLLFIDLLDFNLIIIPRIIYFLILLIILSSFYHSSFYHKKSNFNKNTAFIFDFISAWILLTQLLGQLYLIPVAAFILIQETFLSKIFWKNQNDYPLVLEKSLYLQMAFNAFFYQGNSNNLSTIDISSGYVGLTSYNPFLVGFLIACNTYRFLILWLFLLYFRLIKFHSICCEGVTFVDFIKVNKFFSLLLVYRFFSVALYCFVMFLMQYHLFILSVFAPKLMYEISLTIIFLIFLSIVTISQYVLKKFA